MKGKIRLAKTRYYIDLFVWKDRKDLHKMSKRGRGVDYGGIYKPASYVIYPRRRVSPKLGEIHLYRDRVGGGLISHEVLHCIFDWREKTYGNMDLENHDDQEKMCYMQGELVRKIGIWMRKNKLW